MSGRFLSVPLFAATIALVSLPEVSKATAVALALGLMVIGILSPSTPLFSDGTYANKLIGSSGIADERAFWYQKTGLLSGTRDRFLDLPEWPSKSSAIEDISDVKVVCGGLGFKGLRWGPYIHFVDKCALSDPLLARLPAKYQERWRIGHYHRAVPEGYIGSIRESRNLLEDKALSQYYDRLSVITRSPVVSHQRLLTILRMNLGRYSHLINTGLYRAEPQDRTVNLNRLSEIKPEGTRWNASGNVRLFEGTRLIVDCTSSSTIVGGWDGSIDISLDHNDRYVLLFDRNDVRVGRLEIGPKIIPTGDGEGLARYLVHPHDYLGDDGFGTISISPIYGDGWYAIGHLVLVDNQ
jgi:arabinofuranosyltransferase